MNHAINPQESGKFALMRLVIPFIKRMLREHGISRCACVAFQMLRAGGISNLKNQLRAKVQNSYSRWYALYGALSNEDRHRIMARLEELPYKPKISVVMPVYNTAEIWLKSAIDSVRTQLYADWELCIADDGSQVQHVRKVLAEYAYLDPRIKVVYRPQNGHISAATNSALELVTGEFVVFLDHDDELTEHALYMVVEELNSHPEADLIYSDEDKIDTSGRLSEPHFKCDWNPDLFYSMNMITHLATYRGSILKKIGGLRLGYEGSQDYDLALRFLEVIPESHIRHIPHVLYHWRQTPESVATNPQNKQYAHENARKALRDHFQKRGIPCMVTPGIWSFHRVSYPVPTQAPLVSLIIPTRDGVALLKRVIRGILEETDYPNLEVLIIDNQSRQKSTLSYLQKVQQDPRIRVIPYDAPFNYSAMNNLAVAQARGEIIGLINNDIKIISQLWLKEMVGHALRPGIGAVGAKLYYANGSIQHAGVILGIGGVAGHAHKHFPKYEGYAGRPCVTQNLSAVTAACLIVQRKLFEEVGGLDEEHLRVAFNDVDFCLKLQQRGYRNVFTPFAELYHLESATRGSDNTETNLPRFQKEIEVCKTRWNHILSHDPYYSPNLTLETEDFALAFPPRTTKPWVVS